MRAALLVLGAGQQQGAQKQNVQLPLALSTCTKDGCTKASKSVTLDANWRWVHKLGTSTNCYTGTEWDTSLCPDPKTCAANCAVDGVPQSDWVAPYGVHSDGDGVTLGFVTKGQYGTNVGSRLYMLDGDEYQMFKLKNREFTFDVDVSNLPCGINGALYFVEMPADGGKSFPGNKAGAAFGTGYCDAQCPHDVKFINGEANVLDWTNAQGKYGSCCAEMDIWEANSISTAFTAHVCSLEGPKRCENPLDCGDISAGNRQKGWCDKDGCDFAPYRNGNRTFFGKGAGFAVDSSQPLTVVTQFITSDGTDSGDLVEIRRKWIQNGKTIATPPVEFGGKSFDSITDGFCAAQKTAFDDPNNLQKKGGLKALGEVLDRGMVLTLSIWDDHSPARMLWLDGEYPPTKPASAPGVARGSCAATSGNPTDVESQYPNSDVKYSNIKVGAIGSTTPAGPSPAPPAPPAPSPAPPSGCPGGSLSACIDLCPSDPAVAYKACVQSCAKRCADALVV